MQKQKIAKKSSKGTAMAASRKKSARKVTFRFAAPAESKVFLAGSFNSWSTDEHALAFDAQSGFHQTALALPAGRYEYKFVVNGTWVADPSCPDWVPNEHGSLNSVLMI